MPFDVAVPTREVSQDEQAIVNNYVEEITYQDGTKVMMPVPPFRMLSSAFVAVSHMIS